MFNVRLNVDCVIYILVKRGDRVAQLIIERISTPEVLEVEVSLYF